jgi:hypothetical protein
LIKGGQAMAFKPAAAWTFLGKRAARVAATGRAAFLVKNSTKNQKKLVIFLKPCYGEG